MGKGLCRSGSLAMLLMLATVLVHGDERSPEDAPDPADEALNIADLVIEHHVDPPTRQEMVLAAATSLYRHAFQPVPGTLPRDVSDAASRNSLMELVRTAVNDYCDHVPASALHAERGNLQMTDRQRAEESACDLIRQAIVAVIPGEPSITTAASQQVAAQLDSNRYVGIGISLQPGPDLPWMSAVVAGGPAERAGALAEDRIERIDGRDTRGLNVQDVLSLLRGQEGSIVRLKLRQPGMEARDVVITRGVVPLKTLEQYGLHSGKGAPTIGYVFVTRIAASTVHELDQLRSTLSADGVQGLILDLRGRREGSLHNAVLLADALLDGGTIGIVRYADRDETCTAQQEDLLAAMPLAVLVDGNTGDVSEWLAAALQDHHRAVIVGEQTSGAAFANTTISLADGRHSLRLATAILARGDGRPLLRTDSETTSAFGFGADASESPSDVSEAAASAQPLPWGVVPDLVVELKGHEDGDRMIEAAVALLRKHVRKKSLVDE